MNRFTKSRRTFQAAIIIALLASTILAIYAADLLWNKAHSTTTLSKDNYVTVELTGATQTQSIKPGGFISLAPALTNTGTKVCSAFLKITMPAISGEPVYTFESSDDWSLVDTITEDSICTQIWCYETNDELEALEAGESTIALTYSFTMRSNITGAQFNNMSNVDIEIDGYLIERSAGTIPENVWYMIPENQ